MTPTRTSRAAYRQAIPPVNGELSEIVRREFISDSGGGGEMVNTLLWAGTAPIFVTDEVERTYTSAGAALLDEATTTVVVPSYVPGTVTLENGDVLSYTRNTGGTATHTRRILALEDRHDFGFTRALCREE